MHLTTSILSDCIYFLHKNLYHDFENGCPDSWSILFYLKDVVYHQVVELISMAIGDMTSAEFTCLKDRDGHPTLPESATFKDWEKQVPFLIVKKLN